LSDSAVIEKTTIWKGVYRRSPSFYVYLTSGLILVFLLAGGAAFFYFAERIEDGYQRQMTRLANQKIEHLRTFFIERQSDAEFLAGRKGVQELLHAHARGVASKGLEQSLDNEIRRMASIYSYYDIRLLDASLHTVLATVDDEVDPIEKNAFQSALNSGVITQVDFHVSRSGAASFGFAAPIFDTEGVSEAPIGILYLEQAFLPN